MSPGASSKSMRAVAWLFATLALVPGCASVGAHSLPPNSVQLPLGFEGTWVRKASLSHVPTAENPLPPPAPDTLRLGRIYAYRPDSVGPELSDSARQAVLASPAGAQLAGKLDLESHAPPSPVVRMTTIKLRGDTVVTVSTVSNPDAGLLGKSTTRAYLSLDQKQLLVVTTTDNPVLEATIRNEPPSSLPPSPGPSKRVIVYDRVP